MSTPQMSPNWHVKSNDDQTMFWLERDGARYHLGDKVAYYFTELDANLAMDAVNDGFDGPRLVLTQKRRIRERPSNLTYWKHRRNL